MAKVLFIDTFPSENAQLGGGAWVGRRLMRQMREAGHVVDELAITEAGDAEAEPIPLQVKGNRRYEFKTVLRMLCRREPYQAAKYRWHAGYGRAVQVVRKRAPLYDVVVTVEWPALLVTWDAGVTSDLHIAYNVDAQLAELFDPLLFRLLRNARRMRRWEATLLGNPLSLAALSKRDAQRITKMGWPCEHLCIAEMPDGSTEDDQSTSSIGFIGKMDWPPNRQAVDELVYSVLPKVNESLEACSAPRATVILAGMGSEEYSHVSDVRALGRVEDVAAFYSSVQCIVVPRMGAVTGVSVKLIEAYERGKPVIAPYGLAHDAGLSESIICLPDEADAASVAERVSEFMTERSLESRASLPSGRKITDLLLETGRTSLTAGFPIRDGSRKFAVSTQDVWRTLVSGGRVQTLNLQHYYLALRSRRFMQSILEADGLTADGWPIAASARLRGMVAPKVSGSDLLPLRSELVPEQGLQLAIVGGTDAQVAHLAEHAVPENVAIVHSFTGLIEDFDLGAEVEVMRRKGVDIVLVSLPLPLGDLMAKEMADAGFGAVNIGAGLAMFSGEVPRAPSFVRAVGLEWAFRLVMEPRRLFRRYMIEGLPSFASLILNRSRLLRSVDGPFRG